MCRVPGAPGPLAFGDRGNEELYARSATAARQVPSTGFSAIVQQHHRFELRRTTAMHWYYNLSYFFAGAFLSNSLPHLVNGVSGRAFQSPFAKPSGVGLSSATVNVLWGCFNLAVAYLLVFRVGSFDLRSARHALALGAGFLLLSIFSARIFGRFHGGTDKM
jgi:hypothetical protein